MGAGGVLVKADDLARIVDAVCKRAVGGRGIIERGEVATAVTQKAMAAAGIVVMSDDLAHVVDVECQRGPGAGGRIIERGEGIDRHVVAS